MILILRRLGFSRRAQQPHTRSASTSCADSNYPQRQLRSFVPITLVQPHVSTFTSVVMAGSVTSSPYIPLPLRNKQSGLGLHSQDDQLRPATSIHLLTRLNSTPNAPGLYRRNNVPSWQRLHQAHDGVRSWNKVSPFKPIFRRDERESSSAPSKTRPAGQSSSRRKRLESS